MHMRTIAALAATAIGVPAAVWAIFRAGTRQPTPTPNSSEGGNEQGGQQ